MDAKKIVEKLESIGKDIVKQLELNQNPYLEIPERSLDNVYFDKETGLIKLGSKKQKRYYLNLSQAKKFMQTLLVASKIKWLLEEDKPSLSIRQLYYLLKHTIPGSKENTFDTQDETDPIVEDVEVMLDVLRENLRLIATPNGVLAGDLIVEDKTGDILDYTKMGSAGGAIPPIVEDEYFHIKEINVEYVLVIEKYAVWNVLNQQKFWKKNNCLIITGKGQPARAERRLIHRLAYEYNLPVYVFTDMDPWGYYIYSVYKQGSINLAFFSEKAGTPKAKFLGFQTADVKEFDMPQSSFIKMKDIDYKRIKEMKKYAWFQNKEWQKELTNLEKFGHKIEQDALVSKSIEFTAETYLPTKIENKMFLP
ncbi:MAG: DNA topoisomerase IV subunit A [Candidatus Nanohaloarchaeota archaeon]|nr:DNA topoisomerase IV subunit A [Candidatus Nanohaloarchaeota archaeon]